MSAYVSPPVPYTTGSDDDVSITVGGQQIAGWESVIIGRSAESVPNHFTLTMTEEFSQDPTRIVAEPGAPCEVKVGETLVVTGYIDRYSARIGPRSHEVTIMGRGKCEDLVDCSADLLNKTSPVYGGSTQATDMLTLTQQLCQPFDITAYSNVDDLGPQIRVFQVALGETPYEVIERVARYSGYLVYEDERGSVVLDRVGTKEMASGVAEGINVETAGVTLALDERFTIITSVYSTVDTITEGHGTNQYNQRAHQVDKPFADTGRFRPRIVQSMQTDGTPDFAQRTVDWEMARRIGRSQMAMVTVDTWRDSENTLWTPNRFASVNLPSLKLVSKKWIIGSVVFRKDSSGTHADLVLMPPGAFAVQPSPLNIFDYEMYSAVPASGSPAPAKPDTGPGGLLGRI